MADVTGRPLSTDPRLPDAVLWDMDGTLVDTEPYWISAEHALVERFGGTWTDELAHQLVGNPLLVSADFIIANSPVTLTPHEVVHVLMGSVVDQVREHVPWRPGAAELLAEGSRLGVPAVLVTMSWQPLARAVVDAAPPGSFAHLVTGDEVTHGKPHPEPYLTAADLLAAPPERCLAIEDSPTGVRSAVAAGVPTIAVPHVVPIPDVPGAARIRTLDGASLSELAQRARSASSPPRES
ncbi:HAD family phosphatase [Marihabitans asiaticum]|uniref:HAD superfamily hydrolase (TIGR01509 family) n=1 Tax=Marihabitans asiaticum TaxID=415218 RepID=A0A560W6F4_9MICO|nr:HAD superfamily hydrolase (TIGR01509 family) [Marihabitans asiaticum]